MLQTLRWQGNGHSQLELLNKTENKNTTAKVGTSCLLVPSSILWTLVEDLILGSLVIHPFVEWTTVVQESPHCPALSGVTDSITEHFVYLLLRGHPPIGVRGTVHPNEFCGNTNNSKKREKSAGVLTGDDRRHRNLQQKHYQKSGTEVQCNARTVSLTTSNLAHTKHTVFSCARAKATNNL